MKKPIFTAFLLCLAGEAAAQDYRLPLELPSSGRQPYVTAYRDQNGGGGVQDWNCGSNAYNGHRGTDIGIGGFPVMDAGSRWIVAAANGTVVTAIDGCFDRCTSGTCQCGGGFGNYVRIRHADGKNTYYGHQMNGSIQVQQGQNVSCARRLGKVASSGQSTGPHLHFEPRYSNNVSDDPFGGRCGGPLSYWVNQGAYNALPATTCDGASNPPPPPPPPPSDGHLKGVVWNLSITAGSNDPGNQRITNATIEVIGRGTATSRSPDGYWTLDLPAGMYRIAATAPGFQRAERDVTITSGQDTWASMGLRPIEEAPPPPPPPPPPPADMDAAELIEQSVLMPLEIEPGATFTQRWTLKNTGNTTWSAAAGYVLRFTSGERFGGPDEVTLAAGEAIAPGEEKEWIVSLTAPGAAGLARGAWIMAKGGATFGPALGAEAIVMASPVQEPDPNNPDPPAMPDPMIPQPEANVTLEDDGGCRCTTGSASFLGLLPLAVLLIRRRR